jgi:Uma2 family endonuclease
MNPQIYIPETTLKAKYSYADYLQWKTEKRIELIDGIPFELFPAPSTTHQRISSKIAFKTLSFFEDSKCEVFIAPFDVRLTQKSGNDEEIFTVVQPDLCVICDKDKIDRKGCLGAPDLVVEILSPGNSAMEKRDKFNVYEKGGVREYWMVDFREKMVLVYVLNELGKFIGLQPLTEMDTLVSTIFPKLEINLTELFDLPEEKG